MKASRGEVKIHEILEEAGLKFIEEYSFKDLASPNGRPLRFDFVIFDTNSAVLKNEKFSTFFCIKGI